MSQSGNYRFPSYADPMGTLKGSPQQQMVNGQPSVTQHTQNGGQHSSFNSAGTPSSQSSRDPSRETSRDPSPTQYLHNQYRPQLTRAPMPPINGQAPPPQPNVPMSLPPRAMQPLPANPQNPTNNFAPMQPVNPAFYSSSGQIPPSTSTQSLSSDSGNQTQKSVTPTRYDFPSPNRNNPSAQSSHASSENLGRPLIAVHQGQNLQTPPTSSSSNAPISANPNQPWRNPNSVNDPNLNSQAYSTQPSNLPPTSTATIPTNQQVPTSAANQPWRNPNADPNSNNSSTIPQSYGVSHQNVPPRTSGFVSTPVSGVMPNSQAYPQPLTSGTINPANETGNLRSSQVPPIMPGTNASMQNVFGSTQHVALPSQKIVGPPNPSVSSLSKPQAQFSLGQSNAFGSQANYVIPGAIGGNQTNQSGYGSQQNLASQRQYPKPAYGTLPTGSSNIGGPISVRPGQIPYGPGQIPYGSGRIPMRPPGPGAPPLPGQQPPIPQDNRSLYYEQMSNVPLDNMAKRYPSATYPDQINQMNTQMGNLNVAKTGFNGLWGQHTVDLLQLRTVLPSERVEPPKIKLHEEFLDSVNCSPEIFRCTLTKIPETNTLLQKCRLPLGVLIHPFKDLNNLPVVQCLTIVRCRSCRTYINPFVVFTDARKWKCNLCYRSNELPEEFQFDPVSKSYGDPSRRPEIKTSTIEFIAPSEYMLRPPQPAVYLFLLDISRLAVETGYLTVVCETISDELTKLPGDGRTQVGFLAIDSAIHFFSMPENVSQPHEMIMLDVDDIFLPCPDNLIVNLKEREELIRDLLAQLPTKYNGTHDTNSALGAGLQVAFKLMSATGGRITVFQTCLPNLGPGALTPREDPNKRASKDVPHLNPATDFYKRLALDCSGQQIAVDLFLLNNQYSDLATLSGMCKFSGGCMYHIPLFRTNKPQHSETLEKMLRRYLTRKIGFEAVMRIRCTRGLSIHTFHGNFFVRSMDLLSLPNVNPDAGFGMQVSIEENLSDVQTVCFQAALLYTTSKGERRIRVHTMCLPVSSSMSDILFSADQQAIVGLLSKMAVDRAQQSSLSDARDALINVAIDALTAYKLSQSSSTGGLLAPDNLKLLPMYIIALIKYMAFRSGTSTRLDDRVFSMCQMKSLPLYQLIQTIYPDLYPIRALDACNSKDIEGKVCPQPPRLHLSAEKLDSRGAFLMDAGDKIFIYVGKNIDPMYCTDVLGVPAFASIPEEFYDLPVLDTDASEQLRNFVFSLQEEKPYYALVQIIRDDSHFRSLFLDRLIEDRFENALSYHEFLQHLKVQVK